MGDVVSLVEKAAANIDAEKAARVAEKMRKGKFDLADMREQLLQMQNMGGLGGVMGMLPGVAKMKNQLAAANLDDKILKRQIAVIDSMTREERRNPDLLKNSRKKRISAGSGVKVEEINKLLKMHRNMADMMIAPPRTSLMARDSSAVSHSVQVGQRRHATKARAQPRASSS